MLVLVQTHRTWRTERTSDMDFVVIVVVLLEVC